MQLFLVSHTWCWKFWLQTKNNISNSLCRSGRNLCGYILESDRRSYAYASGKVERKRWEKEEVYRTSICAKNALGLRSRIRWQLQNRLSNKPMSILALPTWVCEGERIPIWFRDQDSFSTRANKSRALYQEVLFLSCIDVNREEGRDVRRREWEKKWY